MPTKSRKDARAVVRLVARYRSPTVFDFVDEECYDLSVGGMFIRSLAPAPAGTLLKLECDVRGRGQQIRGVARVVWVREGETAEGPGGMGVKFVKLDAGDLEVIESIIETVGEAGLNPEEEALRGTGVSSPPPEAAIATGASQRPNNGSAAAQTSDDSADDTVGTEDPGGVPTAVADTAAAAEVAPSGEMAAGQTGGTPAGSQPVEARPTTDSGRAPREQPARRPPESDHRPRAAAGADPAPEPTQEGGGHGWLIGVAAAIALAAIVATQSGDDEPQAGASDDGASASGQAGQGEEKPTHAAAPSNAAAAAKAVAAERPTPKAAAADPTEADRADPSEATQAEAEEPAAAPEPNDTTQDAGDDRKYVLDVITSPRGATVSAGDKKIVAPGRLELDSLAGPMRIEAHKDGYKPTAASIDPSMFTESEGEMQKRIYLSLKPED